MRAMGDGVMIRTLFLCGVAALVAQAVPAQAALIHDFQLNGSYASSAGAGSISPAGGSLGATGYTFGANQGLSIALPESLSVYTIKAAFHFDTVAGYRKIVDFKNLGSDDGLYALNGGLMFFPVAGAAGSFSPGENIVATISRDAAGIVSATLNGVQAWTFADTAGRAIFDSGFIKLFMDDTSYTGEASAGFVDYVQVYDTATITAPVPEPATWAMMIAGFGLVGGAMRYRRGSAKIAFA